MELKDGVIIERDGIQTVYREFEVLPLNAGVVLKASDLAIAKKIPFELALIVYRIRLKDFPPAQWIVEVAEQMSVEDLNTIQAEAGKFDEKNAFSPPLVKV